MIEIGRYNQTTKDNRQCPFCGCNVIEDEVHFLFQCPTYSRGGGVLPRISDRGVPRRFVNPNPI